MHSVQILRLSPAAVVRALKLLNQKLMVMNKYITHVSAQTITSLIRKTPLSAEFLIIQR